MEENQEELKITLWIYYKAFALLDLYHKVWIFFPPMW